MALAALVVFAAGCSGHDPLWRTKATTTLQELQREEHTAHLYTDELASVVTTFQHAEALLHKEGEGELADEQYKLAYQKGSILRQEINLYNQRRREEERQRQLEEQVQREEAERARLEAERKREQELAEAQKNAQRKKAGGGFETVDGTAVPLPASYTVRRGETLPQIAARPELYNDAALWPLIYRANRDQIRDPYQLWPGQVLKIPRHFTRDEALEARRQAHRRGQ